MAGLVFLSGVLALKTMGGGGLRSGVFGRAVGTGPETARSRRAEELAKALGACGAGG